VLDVYGNLLEGTDERLDAIFGAATPEFRSWW
jgi:hypothetical protein